MSIISRRQRELLLNDVSRMINNNNHTAFANQAKIAESVGNGDIKFIIDSPQKEFVIKYGKKEIRFNCPDSVIKELNAIIFNNNTTIKGISDSTLIPSSTIALSTNGGKELKNSIDNKADKTHNHDDKYADINHMHTEYADKNHTHTEYADKTHNHDSQYSPLSHTHSQYQPLGNYSLANHTHSQYADKNHTHSQYADKDHDHSNKYLTKPEIIDLIDEETETPWYEKLFTGLEWIGEGVQDLSIAGMEAQIQNIYSILAANGIVDTAQTTSSLGTCLLGASSKLEGVADIVDKIGDSIESVSDVCSKISEPIKKASDACGKYSKIVDTFSECKNLTELKDMISYLQNGADLTATRLPSTTSVLSKTLI